MNGFAKVGNKSCVRVPEIKQNILKINKKEKNWSQYLHKKVYEFEVLKIASNSQKKAPIAHRKKFY